MHGTRATQAGPCCTLTTRTDTTWWIFMGRWVICQRHRKKHRDGCVCDTDLQWITTGSVWLLCFWRANSIIPRMPSDMSGIPWSGQAVYWKWNTLRASCVEKMASFDLWTEHGFYTKLQCLKWAKMWNIAHWDGYSGSLFGTVSE